MKKILSLLLFLLPFIAYAQLTVVAESQPFDEPEDGYARILALKNGSTAFLHITIKEGIDIRIYDSNHKEIVSKTIEPDYGKLRSPQINGIYEINGKIALFISEIEEHKPTLYRILFDEQNGNLIELKTIANLNEMTAGQGYAVAFGGVPLGDFLVRKDVKSDNYGVVRYNTFETDRVKRVELIQYNNQHVETARAFLSSPDGKYKYTQIIDFVIVGSQAYALLYSYNTASSGGLSNELLFASINNGKVSYENVGKSYKNRISDGVLRYNYVTDHLIFLTNEFIRAKRDKKYYSIQFAIIDPKLPQLKQSISLRSSNLYAKYKRVFDDDDFSPLPQDLFINDDGTFTVLMEEVSQNTATYMTGSGLNGTMQTMHTTNSGTTLGSAAVITYNETGTEISDDLIPKLQTNFSKALSQAYRNVEAYYIAERANSATQLSGGNQYKSFVYLNGKKNNYVMLNDVTENEERIKKGRLTNIKGVGDCDAFVYDLSDTKSNIPPRTMLFKKEKSRDNNLAIFNISDYDRERDIYATLKLEKKKQVKLVWCKGG